MSGPASREKRVLVGVIGAPHGVRGEVRVKSYTAVPLGIADHALFVAPAGGQGIRITAARLLKDDILVVRLQGVTTREAAAALTGKPLYIDRDALPAAEEDEFYHADLIGLAVETSDGVHIGHLAAMLDFGGGDLLEIVAPGREALLVPFAKAFVPVVDIAAGRIVVTPEAVAPPDEADDGQDAGAEDAGALLKTRP